MQQPPSSQVPSATTAVALKYKPVIELGRGGMATVYLAIVQGPAGFNKLQVIKRLRPALAADPEFLQMFLEEARLAARINHPNVVQTNEVGFDGQHYYIAMEYLDGETFEAIGRKTRKEEIAFPMAMQLHILSETLGGLHYAHELTDFGGDPLNVVHRDVSPQNVLVGYDGHIKLLDFGIAKAADSSSDTRTGIMKGKCAYMAPEQFGGVQVDRRVDVFAVGVMLWQALTGRRLWAGLSDANIFQCLSKGEIPSPTTVKADIPGELERICMRALARNREDRYATAAEFQTALETYAATLPSRTTSREIGKYVSDLFAERRAKIKRAIEAEVSKPALANGPGPDSRTSGILQVNVPPLWSLVPGSVSDPNMADLDLSPAVASGSSRAVVPAVPYNRTLRLAALAGVAVLAVAASVYVVKSRSTAAQNTSTPVADSAASAAPAPELVRVTIRATPQEAKLFLDDALLDGNPSTGTFLRDGAAHSVRAEAADYVTKRELAVFDTGALTVEIALDHEKPAAVRDQKESMGGASWYPPPRAASNPPSTASSDKVADQPAAAALPTSNASSATPAATKPPPAIDTGDPWANSKPRTK